MMKNINTIMIVEDENIIALDIKLSLKKLGYKISSDDTLKRISKTSSGLLIKTN